ncbi:MAG: Kdo hydroxylase family protein [Burkholderiales bacterium]|nr:Kdo hydroxylase family protein [Burkholderiales bacterium]MDE2274866.1 Kdo hydroxylase family protein [Burkholderiales bacterium]
MNPITRLRLARWDAPATADEQAAAVDALEQGSVLLLPQLPFALQGDEVRLLSAALEGKGKNISLDPLTGRVRGTDADAALQRLLQGLLQRYAAATRALLQHLLPGYGAALQQARTSFRPAEIAGRQISWRKDDTRLHVDSFPSSPTQGTRILRVFSNVNPSGQPRVWRLGAPFEDVARRFLPALRPPRPGSSALMHWLHVTKRRRSAYDHYMLGLHDAMKADAAYQAEVPQVTHAFEPGCTWLVYTDQASHAAMRGQYALEQTWHLPVAAMHDPARSPLRVLERLSGRALV